MGILQYQGAKMITPLHFPVDHPRLAYTHRDIVSLSDEAGRCAGRPCLQGGCARLPCLADQVDKFGLRAQHGLEWGLLVRRHAASNCAV